MTLDLNAIERQMNVARASTHSGIYDGVWAFAPKR